MNIRLNISHAFYNKTNKQNNKSALSYSFYPITLSLPDLVKHIRSGKAFSVGCFDGNRRIESRFVSSQLLALDLDNCPLGIDELEYHSFIADHAFLMYPTPSSTPEKPKSRVLFVLDEVVVGQHAAKRWRALQMGLIAHFDGLKPDCACKDPARLFYGCDTCKYYINYSARLPLSIAANLVIPAAEQEELTKTQAAYAQSRPAYQGNLSPLVNKWLSTAHAKISAAPHGERHDTFVRYARWLYGLQLGDWPITKADIERFMSNIATAWGDDDTEIKRNLQWAEENATAIAKERTEISPRGQRVGLMKRYDLYGTATF